MTDDYIEARLSGGDYVLPASEVAGYLDQVDDATRAALGLDDPNVAGAVDIVDDPEQAIGDYADTDANLDAERALDVDTMAGGDDQIGDQDQPWAVG